MRAATGVEVLSCDGRRREGCIKWMRLRSARGSAAFVHLGLGTFGSGRLLRARPAGLGAGTCGRGSGEPLAERAGPFKERLVRNSVVILDLLVERLLLLFAIVYCIGALAPSQESAASRLRGPGSLRRLPCYSWHPLMECEIDVVPDECSMLPMLQLNAESVLFLRRLYPPVWNRKPIAWATSERMGAVRGPWILIFDL